jgi:hypothetical protein
VEIGDSNFTDPGAPGSNLPVSLGQATVGQDGNVYLMRRTPSPVIYAISSAGSVVHRFQVESPDPAMMPAGLQASANRLAVLFRDENTKQQLLKIIDMETGDPAGQFKADNLSSALACFQAKENRFVFMTNTEDKLAFDIAEPK